MENTLPKVEAENDSEKEADEEEEDDESEQKDEVDEEEVDESEQEDEVDEEEVDESEEGDESEEEEEEVDEDAVPEVYTDNFAIYIPAHGTNVLNECNIFKKFTSPINITKITAVGLCDSMHSYIEYDYFIPIFINDINKYYKKEYQQDIFNDPKIINEVVRYIICKIHPELKCRLVPERIQHYHNILLEKTYTYPEVIYGKVTTRENVPYEDIIDSLLQIVRSRPEKNKYKHTSRYNTSREQRNKIFSCEKEDFSLETDIICLMPYYNQQFGITLKRGDSLFQFFYNYNKTYKGVLKSIILAFQRKHPDAMDNEHDFNEVIMKDIYINKDTKNITSVSLKFLLFFFEYIGIRNITVVDFSCGGVDCNIDENREQGGTAPNSPTLEDQDLGAVLKDPGVAEEARGKKRTRKYKKKTLKKRSRKYKKKTVKKRTKKHKKKTANKRSRNKRKAK